MNWSDKLLQNKGILISGASSGIGKVCAVVCSRLGARIVALGRDQVRLAETLASLEGEGHLAINCELTDIKQLNEDFSALDGSFPISGFIHSAGVERTNPLKGIDADGYADMLKVNLIAGVMIAQRLSRPKILDRNGSSFVFISSISGTNGEKGKIEYSSSKSALYGMAKSMARELAGKGIRVNCVSPAMVNTPMLHRTFSELPEESVQAIKNRHLLGLIEPEEVANLCAYLISDLAKSITGTNIIIDGGYSLT